MAVHITNKYQIRAFQTGKVTQEQVLKVYDYGDLHCLQQEQVTLENSGMECFGVIEPLHQEL